MIWQVGRGGGGETGRGEVVGGGETERGRESIYITSSLISCHQLLSSEEPETNN